MKIALGIFVAILIIGGFLLLQNDTNDEMNNLDTDGSLREQNENDSMSEDDNNVDIDTSLEADTDVSLDTEEVVINLEGFMHGYSMDTIEVNEGDTVTINFTSTDGFHDWVVDEFDAATAKVQTGGTASVTFVADEAGTYEFYCSVGNHRAMGMVGTLVVN